MASSLQQAVSGMQLNNYATGLFINLWIYYQWFSLLFPVVVIIAVGYDYSK